MVMALRAMVMALRAMVTALRAMVTAQRAMVTALRALVMALRATGWRGIKEASRSWVWQTWAYVGSLSNFAK